MVDAVDFRTEKMIPELEYMLKKLFEKDEVQAIYTMRRDFESKVCKISKRKDDFIKYINFETQFLRMLKLRHKKSGNQDSAKMSKVVIFVGRRLHKLFVFAIRSFPQDLRLWIAYVKFCQQTKFGGTAASRVLEQMLDQHGHSKPELFKLAARIEETERNDIEKARKYLLMGIHIHKDNKLLLTEAFRLELIDAERKRIKLKEKNLTLDSSNIHTNVEKAENIYAKAIKKFNDLELLNELIKICANYDFASMLQKTITKDMKTLYEDNERMWDIIAKNELNIAEGKSSYKEKIEKCVTEYKRGIKTLNTDKMWAYYLDTLIDLHTKDTSRLPTFKRKLLLTALEDAANAGKLTEKYYLKWVSLWEGVPGKHKRMVDVLQGAVDKLPNSVTLWLTLLRIHLTKGGEEKQANQVFDKGVAALRKDSLPLWKLMLQYEQTKCVNKVEELFNRGCNDECPEISRPLTPMYLEWLVLSKGIVMARKIYEEMCEKPSACLEMHKKMVYLELIQPGTMNRKMIRKCYAIACAQFGEVDVDVWVDFYKFELKHGVPKKVKEVYWAAIKNLPQTQFDLFLSELTILKSQHQS